MKKILLIAFAFIATSSLFAQDFTAGGINYSVTSATAPFTVAVASHTSFTGAANIPATVINAGTTYSVTSIGIDAFRDCTGLTSVSIPSSVKIIGATAFRNCTGLTSINIPSSVTIIEDQVFQSCTGLTSVIIPSSVTSVGTFAFGYCTGLTSVTIPSSVTTIGSGAFIDCKGLTSISIPSAVTSILFGAFSGCTGLTAVTVNWATPLAIGADVFQGITLSNVALNIPASTAALYDAAAVWTNFNIQGLVVAPIYGQRFTVDGINYIVNKATTPYEVAVSGHTSFTGAANIPETVSYAGNTFAVTEISNYAFSGCNGLTSVTIPNSVTSLGSNVFEQCTNLTSVTISNMVTIINTSTFYDCTSLTSVIIPNSVINIGPSAFYGCTSLTSLTIPNSVTIIEEEAFFNCTGLTSIIIPDSVTSIGRLAFYGCSGLTSITISNQLASIGNSVFQNCTGLTAVTIPNAVTSIGQTAFRGCTNLTTVSLPNSLTTIGLGVFADCSALTSMTIPSSVTSIGQLAFFGCTGLTSVTVNWATPLTITADVFQDVTLANVVLNVPTGTAALYDAAAVWTDFNLSVALSNGSFNKIADINLYPNPSNGIFNFQLANDLQIEVYNNLGQLLQSEKMFSGNNTINIADKAAGIYFLKANDGNNVSTYKMIKN